MNKDSKIVWIAISDLIPYEHNAKEHTMKQVENLKKSLTDYGWQNPCLITRDNVLVTGHGRILAAKALGLAEAPCIYADDLTDEQIKEYRHLDNLLSEGGYIESELRLELQTVDISGYDFSEIPVELEDINVPRKAGFEFDDEYLEFGEDATLIIDKKENAKAMQGDAFENQEVMQFDSTSFYGIPPLEATQTVGDEFIRFADWKECDNPQDYIAHFYYDDYKFMAAYREPNKYVERLKQFKAVIAPDFSLYTDFPRALQILSCYRRNWCGAYWQYLGIDVIPDVVWGDKDSFEYCFDGLPKHSTVAVSAVGVSRDKDWNGKNGDMFRDGYSEMLKRLEPTTILYYGTLIDGLEGNIIHIPSFYDEKREMLNERKNNG